MIGRACGACAWALDGRVFITLKEAAFEPLSPIRHMAEINSTLDTILLLLWGRDALEGESVVALLSLFSGVSTEIRVRLERDSSSGRYAARVFISMCTWIAE